MAEIACQNNYVNDAVGSGFMIKSWHHIKKSFIIDDDDDEILSINYYCYYY